MCTTKDSCRYARVSELFVYEKFSRVPAESVEAGDICAVCGVDDIQARAYLHVSIFLFLRYGIYQSQFFSCPFFLKNYEWFHFFGQIGETIADKVSGKPLPAIKVEEPTVKMSFSINTSPFVGREVCVSKRNVILLKEK